VAIGIPHPLREIHTFQIPTKIMFGVNAVRKVSEEARKLTTGRRALIVTSPPLHERAFMDDVRGSLERENFEVNVLSEIEPEPGLEIAETVAKESRRAAVEIVVGVGGGSVLDMAKVASFAVTNQRDVSSYVGVNQVKNPAKPLILVPTTAGTGSEVSNVAIVSLVAEEIKSGIVSPYLYANVAIVDPTLTITMPPGLTAQTGVDALSHAIEAIMSTNANPLTDALALEAIRLIANSLTTAYRQGENLDARCDMSLAAMMAGLTIGNAGVCGAHAAAYAFAVKCKISHGISCGIALPYVMKYNLPAIAHKLKLVARAIGESTNGSSSHESAKKAIVAVKNLNENLSIPINLKSTGLRRDVLPKLADDMLKSTRLLARQPRKIENNDALKLFEEIWEGSLEL